MEPRIAVVGVGGIGGSIAANLLRAGHDVTMIDQWAANVEAIRADGLTLTDIDAEFTVQGPALHISDVSGIAAPFDLVFLSVKGYDTVWSTHLIAPHLKPGGCVLPAMNALPDEAVAGVVGWGRTVGCVATISAGMYRPGHVVRTDIKAHAFTVGELHGLSTPRARLAAELLGAVGPSDVTSNIWGARWAKMVWNCMSNALAGLLGDARLDAEQRRQRDRVEAALGYEAAAVATGLGVALEPVLGMPPERLTAAGTPAGLAALSALVGEIHAQRGLTPEQAARLPAPGRPSLLQDVLKGRRTEVQQLNGQVVAEGRRIGVATPVNAEVLALMDALAAGQWQPGVGCLARLLALTGA